MTFVMTKNGTLVEIKPRKQGLVDKNTSIKDNFAGSMAFTNVPRQVMILPFKPTPKGINFVAQFQPITKQEEDSQ